MNNRVRAGGHGKPCPWQRRFQLSARTWPDAPWRAELNPGAPEHVGNGMQIQKSLGLLAFLGASLSTAPVQAAPAQVRTVSPQSLKAEIARNKGKVVVVNFWATWCAPCVKELPALAQLQSKTKGAVLLLVSADDPAIKTKVAQVAGSKGHRLTRQISSDIDIFFGSFDPKNKDSISLPRTYIYNRKGVLVKTITQEQTLAGYQKILKPFL